MSKIMLALARSALCSFYLLAQPVLGKNPEKVIPKILAEKPPGVSDHHLLYLRDKDVREGGLGVHPLLVMVRYPGAAKDERTLDAINSHLLGKHLYGDASHRDRMKSEDWASYYFARSTYMAAQLYLELERKFPKGSVGLAPVIMGYDGNSHSLSHPYPPPAALVYVDVSAVARPSVQRFEGCGTCGAYISPMVYVLSQDRFGAAPCLESTSRSRYSERGWDTRELMPSVGNAATYWLSMDLAGYSTGDQSPDEKTCWPIDLGARLANPGDVPVFPHGPTTWLRKNLKNVSADQFLSPERGHAAWGGYLGWVTAYTSREVYHSFDRKSSKGAVLEHYAQVYGVGGVSGREDLLIKAADAERRFYAGVSSQWANDIVNGEFGRAYREFLVKELEVEKKTNRALLGLLLTAGLTGFTNSQSGQSFSPLLIRSQAQMMAVDARTETTTPTMMMNAHGQALSLVATSVGDQDITVSAASLLEFRSKVSEILFPPQKKARPRKP